MSKTLTLLLGLACLGVGIAAGASLIDGSGNDTTLEAPKGASMSEAGASYPTDGLPPPAASGTDRSEETPHREDATIKPPPHDRIAWERELEATYRAATLDELREAMGLARFEYSKLREQAMSEQIQQEKYSRAAQVEAGFTPQEILDRRPTVRYSHQVVMNPRSMEPPAEGIWVVEYYVREDEYPDVYRAFDEWNWLKRRIKSLEGQER